ncbi:MAG: 3-hydroxyacyl-CoA dehydrogenase NAD-binding domain-containing protein [Ornithinimicrobium sp.]|uniref:3-hydroxyacyl-CoA dehydrogenase NAD-binding domain-containing protein n=1 Tax=Ornithinimicrobium sp. TaxID=1977084 RepID=UPI003D9B88C4
MAVVGAGAMGAGIAQVAAQAGHDVYVVDAREGAAAAALDSTGTRLRRMADKGRVTAEQAETVIGRLHVAGAEGTGSRGSAKASPHPAGTDVADLPPAGLVVEAVVEDLGVKREIFAALASSQPPETVLATNTSSLDISAIAEGLPRPERVIGLHFFNPPPLMRLVEVIRGDASSRQVLDDANALMRAWGKTPVECASSPGFIVNRVARPFYGEAQRMVADGTLDAASLDTALRGHAGFRMGPMELTDLIGQDVNLAVGTSVWEQTGRDPRYEPTAYQQQLVAAGRLGRKTGHGVYRYDEQGLPLDAEPDHALVERLVGGDVTTDPVARTLAMIINEAVDLVHHDVAGAEDVDTAMRLGTNYPKGPHEWLHELGAERVRHTLQTLDRAFSGGRYRPSPGLMR